MAVTTATLGRDVIGNISHFDCEFPESYSGDPTNPNTTLMNHDITHCSGEGCPKKKRCYRYRAYKEMHIAEVVQVFTEPPYFEGECKFFIED